ncbi:MAG: thymidine phosphorylase [Bryobacteraceae bacterium]|jgi:pyrimidine-nucleoside phosphorylase/thymidine phosphorylase
MRTVDLIHRKREGEELSPQEIAWLVDGYTRGSIPDYQMSAFLMAVYYSGMTDREVTTLTDCMVRSGETVDLSSIPGLKVDKHSTGGVGDKTSLISAPLAAAAGAVIPMISGRGLGHTGGTLDKLESIPGFRTDLTIEEFRGQLAKIGLCFIGQTVQVAPADGKLYSLRDATATVESIPLIASSIMSKKIAEGLDALVLDVKVGSGAFMKRQVDARRLAQMMVGIGRRMDKRVQALITDMSQPLGYAIGNALEVMEVSQTLQSAGPNDLTRLSLELAARMIHLGKVTETIDEARELAQRRLLDGSGYRKFKEVIQAQGGNPQVLDRFDLLPNASGAREIASPRSGFVSQIKAEDIGLASSMIGAGRDTKEAEIDPAVGVILEVKVGEKVEAGAVLCRLYHTKEDHLDEAAQLVEDAFRISSHPPEERELILEVVG